MKIADKKHPTKRCVCCKWKKRDILQWLGDLDAMPENFPHAFSHKFPLTLIALNKQDCFNYNFMTVESRLSFLSTRASVCVRQFVSLWICTRPFDILFFLCHLTIEKCSFLPLMTQRHITWELIAVLLVFIEPFHNIFTYTRIFARARLVFVPVSVSVSIFVQLFSFFPHFDVYTAMEQFPSPNSNSN